LYEKKCKHKTFILALKEIKDESSWTENNDTIDIVKNTELNMGEKVLSRKSISMVIVSLSISFLNRKSNHRNLKRVMLYLKYKKDQKQSKRSNWGVF
jgi:hypothetical protein